MQHHMLHFIFLSWGCDHKDDARQHYCAVVSPQHTNFTSRLVISKWVSNKLTLEQANLRTSYLVNLNQHPTVVSKLGQLLT